MRLVEDAWIHQIGRVKTHRSVTARLNVGAFSQEGRTRVKPEKLDTKIAVKMRAAQIQGILRDREDEWEEDEEVAMLRWSLVMVIPYSGLTV